MPLIQFFLGSAERASRSYALSDQLIVVAAASAARYRYGSHDFESQPGKMVHQV